MSRGPSGINVAKAAEGEQHKQRIYDCLLNKSMSRRECYETVKLSKNQFTHYMNFLVENGYVKIRIGKCALYKRDKVHILSANKDYPFVARTQEEIQIEVDEKNHREALIKPHVRVIRLINSRPYNFHKKKKNEKVHIQSSFNML